MLMRGLGVTVGILAMIVGRARVLLPFLMITVVEVMCCLPVVMRGRLMLRSGLVMMFTRRVLLFLGH